MTEEKQEKSEVYRFGECVLDAGRRELTLSGKPVTTQPKAFELLLYLVRHRDRAVDKDELQDALWPRSIVTETALTRCVMKARRAVGDNADRQDIIKTVHGHGYRFVASMQRETEATAARVAEPAPDQIRRRRPPLLAMVAATAAVAIAGWWLFTPAAVSGEVRLAVLPAENSTGDTELDWVRTGMMSLMNRMLESKGVVVVSERSVIDLAGDKPIDELTRTDGEFDTALRKTTGHTHTLATEFEFEQGLYRLNYTLTGGDIRPQRRTIVGKEPTRLVKEAIDTITSLIRTGPPPNEHMRVISDDDFLNEAYARAMSLEFEGNYEDAKRFFQVIIEQDPALFWPRYEYALCVRNLRDFENAERLLTELVNEQKAEGNTVLEAISTNGLGILYLNQRRNDEALNAFNTVIRLATETQKSSYVVTGHVNLALLTRNMGDINAALSHMLEAEKVLESQDLSSFPGTFHNTFAGILMRTGNLGEAERHALAAIENFNLTGRRLFAAYSQSRLATIYRASGRYQEALDLAEESLAVRREFNDQRGISASLSSLGEINVALGNLTRARQYAEQVYDIGVQTDDDEIKAAALYQRAQTERLLGEPRTAAGTYAEAETIRRSMDDPSGVDNARVGIARSWLDLKNFDGAEGIGQELLQSARDDERERLEARALILLGEVDLAHEAWSNAVIHYNEALNIATRIGDGPLAFSVRASLARAWLEAGDPDAAQVYLEAIVLERPEDTEVNKLQARMAWERGDPVTAAELMTRARNTAGEAWREEDEANLERFRAAQP
ncbi:MAG: tetratricopeptide repeat protein [Gammaproteobacteria bacterium]|nr:tetratricopeptide repeat protein [Gammaproteobacteria bacterium]